jgi:hypothetical protein
MLLNAWLGAAMRRYLGAAAAFIPAVLLLGCSSSTGVADCSTTVRYEGSIYRESGFTENVADEIGSADLADCDEVNGDMDGFTFSDNPDPVTVWAIAGKDPATTIAIAYPDGGYRVMKVLDGG